MTARGFIVAAPRSGSGKTTVTLAILAALRRRGVRVGAAKSGPDYIDPGFHAAASGRPCPNLDSWAMPPPVLDGVARDAARGAELVVVESAMGLFDGVDGVPIDGAPIDGAIIDGTLGRRGSAADLAARYGLPVLLVLDVSGQMQSAAAVARGFAGHEPGVRVAGVVLNRAGSERHRDGAARALTAAGLPVLGSLGRDAGLALPERHLGLVQAGEHAGLPALLDRLAAAAEASFDLEAVIALAAPFVPAKGGGAAGGTVLPPPGQRVALAQDQAFSFLYAHVLDGWRRLGAEIVPFSPLADEAPPESCDACWLPGGYPELHAGALAAAGRFRDGLARFARTRPVHGECGGHMVLGQGLEDAAGTRHAMAGLLGHSTSLAQRRMHLGYREARLLADGMFGAAGTRVRGHEFHYARTIDAGPDEAYATLHDARGRVLGPGGGRRGRVTGSFFHAIALLENQP